MAKHIASSKACGVLRVAFDLGRTSHLAFDQDTVCGATERHGGGKELCFARHHILRCPHVRHKVFLGLAGTRSEARQAQCRPHELEKGAAAEKIVPLRYLLRKLAGQKLLEPLSRGQLIETAPVLLTLGCFQAGAQSSAIYLGR